MPLCEGIAVKKLLKASNPPADAPIPTAVREMEARRPGAVTSLVVVEEKRPVGVLHLHDCLGVGPVRPR